MKAKELRKKFIKYFKSAKHVSVDSSSLITNNDPTVLLTTAGMQQFLPYFLGKADPQKDFKGINATSVQKCFRTSDIDSVGDANHLTFFEMLGNFSFGGYFKEEAIKHAYEFLTKTVALDPDRIWATIFEGDDVVERDHEAEAHWQKHIPAKRISANGREDNWWGPPGKTGPCGPSSEAHYDQTGQPCTKGKRCLPNCQCGRFVEIWNLVFMQYNKGQGDTYTPLDKGQIDTGMGFERLLAILQDKATVFETDVFEALIEHLTNDESFGYGGIIERLRIAADHLRGSVFLLSDGVLFSNKEQGYILRRVFRKALDQYKTIPTDMTDLVDVVIGMYGKEHPQLKKHRAKTIEGMNKEIEAYSRIANLHVEDVFKNIKPKDKVTEAQAHKKLKGPSDRKITAEEAFQLFSTYGLTEQRLTNEGYEFDKAAFNALVEEHKSKLRAGAEQKFGGHGIDDESVWDPEQLATMKTYHTATHLVHQALRIVLGDHVKQEGSDINPERLRFDFQHPSKMTDDEKKKVEDMVNDQVRRKLPVSHKEMSYEEAISAGALAFFKDRYPDTVTVYSMGDFSKEICGGPHVNNTGDINGTFKITSEKSTAAGIRRIKAIVE